MAFSQLCIFSNDHHLQLEISKKNQTAKSLNHPQKKRSLQIIIWFSHKLKL